MEVKEGVAISPADVEAGEAREFGQDGGVAQVDVDGVVPAIPGRREVVADGPDARTVSHLVVQKGPHDQQLAILLGGDVNGGPDDGRDDRREAAGREAEVPCASTSFRCEFGRRDVRDELFREGEKGLFGSC